MMKPYSLSHLADHVLLRELTALVAQDRATTAALLAHLAEVDERKLYRPAAYDSMYLFCVKELHMSEDTAFRRIAVARMARRFPSILPALADGRLNMTAVLLLAPHLTPATAEALLAAAAWQTKEAIRLLLAQRFPQPDLPTLVQSVPDVLPRQCPSAAPVAAGPASLAPEQAVPSLVSNPFAEPGPLAPERVVPSRELVAATSMVPVPLSVEPRPRLAPLSPGRYALQVTLDEETYEQLRRAQALLGHVTPSGDVATVLKRALELLVESLEKRKFARCARPGPRRSSANGRYVPAEIRRAVRQRDGDQCTFVSDKGKRCEARARLEFDHVDPVARGGQTTVAGLRLRCRAHNQYTAECTYGAGFMREKREAARIRTARAREQSPAATRSRSGAPPRSEPALMPTNSE